jgi:nucleoside-diphosphate-sugar epimerase
MKVLVAGAAGAIGKQLLPRLAAGGHDVFGMTRSAGNEALVRELGATPLIADALDPDQVAAAVAAAEPEAIVHELTGLSSLSDMRHFDRDFELTNRLRTEATDHLLSAGRAVSVRRFVAQSYAGWPYAREGGPVKTEEDPLDPTPVAAMARTLAAIRRLESTVTAAGWTEGIVLRYGGFYGPGTSLAPDGEHTELIRKRRFPVDDDPAQVSEWLPALAAALGAKPPRRVPRWLGRLVAGEAAAVMMTEVRGASNAKAKRELGWQPAHPSWRQGLAGAAA